MNLIQKIRLGEDTKLEYKEVIFKANKVSDPHRNSVANGIAAFANTEGGTFIFGVSDQKQVVGIPLEMLDILESWVKEICHDVIKPEIHVGIFRELLEDKPILRLDIPKSVFVHKGANGYFHRVGSSKREMSPEYLARLFQLRSQSKMIYFDETPVADTSINSLDPLLAGRFFINNSLALMRPDFNLYSSQTELCKLHLLTETENGLAATVAGVLLCNPTPRKFLPNAYIQAVCYGGLERHANTQLDARDIDGPLDQQIRDALHFVKRNMLTGATKEIGRQDFPQYSLDAVFEAIVNAVAHRDYSIYDSKIRLHMFKDRLEIASPGAIANTMSIDSMPLRQATRNELIASLLAKCEVQDSSVGRHLMMDKRGEGVPLILGESQKLSGKQPTYRLVGDELQLTIFATSQPHSK